MQFIASKMNNIFNWNEIDNNHLHDERERSLLLGNGFSINLYNKFNYKSLYDAALEAEKLNEHDVLLFNSMDTRNFEYVLRVIKYADIYLKNNNKIEEIKELGINPSEHYQRIRDALLQSIIKIHYKWTQNDEATFKKLSEILKGYKSIFTTNYDLLLYWIIMKDSSVFRDLFGRERKFSLIDRPTESGYTPIYYLHGSIALYHGKDDHDAKRCRDEETDLLTIIRMANDEYTPLIVTESDSQDKNHTIANSEYLEFCLGRFKGLYGKNLVIFGHSLDKRCDAHILEILKILIEHRNFKVAISIYNPEKDEDITQKEIQTYTENLSLSKNDANLLFYYSDTHPLGNSDLELTQD